MPEIKKSVGDQSTNSSDDVALVQLMLRVVQNAKGQPYFAGDYTGTYDPALKTAITQFQLDQKLIQAPAAAAGKGPPLVKAASPKAPAPLPGSAEKPGQLGPGSKTLAALLTNLPPQYNDVRIIPGTKTIYVAGSQVSAVASAAKIRADQQLNADFREKVAQLVEAVYKEHKLVLGIPPDGWRRDFKAQANVNPAATGAGPGESPHQFGRAVDIGFASFKFVTGSGQIKSDSFWIDSQGLSNAKQSEFWQARNAIAFQKLGLHKTNKAGDLIHVQGFDDAKVSWGVSLAKLLETVSPAKAKWSVVPGQPNQYKVDLGLGSALTVGSANALWAGQAKINKADWVKVLNAKLVADPSFSVEKFFGVTAKAPPPPVSSVASAKAPLPGNVAPAKPTPLKETDITPDYEKYLQNLLQGELQAADSNWDKWTPVK